MQPKCNQKDIIVLPISIHAVVENLVKRPKKLQYLFNIRPYSGTRFRSGLASVSLPKF